MRVKKIEAIIKPHRLEDAKAARTGPGVRGRALSDVRGYGRQKGHPEQYRGAEHSIDLLPKATIEVVVAAGAVDAVVLALGRAARTGEIGDGIVVSPLDSVVRIRTGEEGEAAVS